MAKARKKTSATMKAKAIVRDEVVSDPVDSGIYITPGRKVYRTAEGMKSVFRRIAEQWDLPAMMDDLERGARLIVADFDGTVQVHDSGFIDADVPADAEPVARDAASALEWIGKTRHHLQRGNAQEAAVCAYHLGRVAERVYVRRFEPMAKAGREHHAYVGGKCVKLTDLERSIVRQMRDRQSVELHTLYREAWDTHFTHEKMGSVRKALSLLTTKLFNHGVTMQFSIDGNHVKVTHAET